MFLLMTGSNKENNAVTEANPDNVVNKNTSAEVPLIIFDKDDKDAEITNACVQMDTCTNYYPT